MDKNNGDRSRPDKGPDLAPPHSKPPSTRVGREAPKYLLRLPHELRDWLQREANINGRSLNSEIIQRLEASRVGQEGGTRRALAEQPRGDYTMMTELERSIMTVVKRLSPEKQLALLSLFK